MLLNVLKKVDLPAAETLLPQQLYQLIAAYVLSGLAMFTLFPTLINTLVAVAVVLKIISVRWHFQLSKWLIALLFILLTAAIFSHIRQLGKEYTGLCLLFAFAALKLLETHQRRDAFLLMLIHLLLIMGALMVWQSFLAFVYFVFCFLYNIYLQLRIAQPAQLGISIKGNLISIAKILLFSSPLVVALFFLFPRIEPLWQAPDMPRSVTGLSDEMTPNSLSSLVQDGGLAFRVKFDGDIPEKNQLYWRGPVLVNFDGKTWRRNNRGGQQSLSVNENSRIDYHMYHTGATGSWLVPLDMPAQAVNNTALTSNFELFSGQLLKGAKVFHLSAYFSYRTQKLSHYERKENTQLPPDAFPKAKQLARRIRKVSKNNRVFTDNLWQYFRKNNFYYDLAPPAGNADIDIFLFGNRRGYCEHFASAFVFMLRSQNVPARVVTGYQGGEINPISKELEVKQLNAHAWAEVYLKGKGWVRYDPTAAISPDRINRGSPFGVASNTDSIAATARWEYQFKGFRYLKRSLRAINAFWQNWILNYDRQKQDSLWQKLGLAEFKSLVWLALLLVASPLLFLLWWWHKKRMIARDGDALSLAMRDFFYYVGKQQLPVLESQGLQNWLIQNEQALGLAKKYANNVVTQYYQLRYHSENSNDSAAIYRLKTAIRLFKKQFKKL